MAFFKGILNFYIESSIHVSLAVCCFVLMSFWSFEIALDWAFMGFIFSGSITGYNFVKYAPFAGFHHRSLARNLKVIQVFSFCFFLLFVYFFFQMPLEIKLWSIGLGIPTLLYAIPFLKSKSLRSFSGLKIFIVALVWAGVTVMLPWIWGSSSEGSLWITVIQRFLWVIVLIIPFEIRDLVFDSADLGTIPQQIGIQKTKQLGMLLLLIVFFLEFLKREIAFPEIVWLFLMLILTAVFVKLSTKNQSIYFASFWVESVPIVSAVLFLLMKSYLFSSL